MLMRPNLNRYFFKVGSPLQSCKLAFATSTGRTFPLLAIINKNFQKEKHAAL